MDVVFLLNTYNRQESCQRLVDALQGLGDIIVLNDGCNYVINNCNQYFLPVHNGKQRYFETVNALFRLRGDHKYYIMLPDDCLPKPNIVSEALRIWSTIPDINKICLNLLADRIGTPCWTRFMPVDKGEYYHTQWVDMCFMAEDRFFNVVHLWGRTHCSHNRSSGVGAMISTQLHKRKFGLYQVKESLIDLQPEHCITQMNSTDQVYDNNRRRYVARTKRADDTRRRFSGGTGR